MEKSSDADLETLHVDRKSDVRFCNDAIEGLQGGYPHSVKRDMALLGIGS